MTTARRLIARGRVQGVFYRDWTVETAAALGLAGWVRNLPDGTVKAHVEGPQAAVDRMIAAMHDGPARAAPDTVDAEQTGAQGYERFERR